MPLYNSRGSDMPQAAQAAINSATRAMGSQQKSSTTTTKQNGNWWDDFYKAARGIQAGAGALNSLVNTTGDAIRLYDGIKIKSAYDNIAKAFGEGGYAAIQNNPNMQDYHHSQALRKFVKDRANTQQGYLGIVEKSDEAADRLYQIWRAQAMTVGDAYRNGNVAGIGVIQNPLDDYNASPRLFAYGRNDRQIGVLDGLNGLIAHGLSHIAPQKGKRSGGNGNSGGEYKLTQGDTSMLVKYATRPDENGDKSTDYGTVSFLSGIMKKTGLDAPSAIVAYETNVKRAMAQGATREQAEAAVMSAMARQINGGQPANAGGNAHTPTQESETGGTPIKAENADEARIMAAASGNGRKPKKENNVRRAQEWTQGVMEGIGAFVKSAGGDGPKDEDPWQQ